MTELEKLKRAKMYIDKMANGINPIDGATASDEDVINNIRVSRCLFYVSEILARVIENGGEVSATVSADREPKPKVKKQPFFIGAEQLAQFPYSVRAVSISEFVKTVNSLVDEDAFTKLKSTTVTSWLRDIGLLQEEIMPSGKVAKRPTAQGAQAGIFTQERLSMNGVPYIAVVYGIEAQKFIIDNMDALIELNAVKKDKTKEFRSWTKEQDTYLSDMFVADTPVDEIAQNLKRTRENVLERLERLGFDISLAK